MGRLAATPMATSGETTTGIPVNKDHLAVALEVLGNANRLDLLEQLRVPRTVSEIELSPAQTREGENPERLMSRQAVRVHLARLAEIGVVYTRKARRGAVAVDEYALNHPRLFALFEDLRSLGTLQSEGAPLPGAEPTLEGAARDAAGRVAQPHVVLVRGLHEGRAFPLTGDRRDGHDRGWVIGRRADLAVSLDYDPYVSVQNSEVVLDGAQYRLHDLRSSRNGTFLNWQRLPRGGSAALRHGDVIGVGRSLLLFRAP